jgi:hypothetical protein
MAFRRIALIYGSLAAAGGLGLMLWGPMLLDSLGDYVDPNFGTYSLIRLVGAGFFLLGALLLAVQEIRDRTIQVRISYVMGAAHAFAGLIVLGQEIAIWNSLLGGILAALLWAACATFALFLCWTRQSPRAVPA